MLMSMLNPKNKFVGLTLLCLLISVTHCEEFLGEKENNHDQPIDLVDIFNIVNNTVTNDALFKHQAFEKTAYIVDTFGPRLWGSQALEDALTEMNKIMIQDNFEKSKLEEVPNVTKWERGEEYLILNRGDKLQYQSPIPMIGLGNTVDGFLENVEVVVVTSKNDLDSRADSEIQGKIVLFNDPWNPNLGYGDNVKYRSRGSQWASNKGAVGVIIRSVTSISLETPHTGKVNYGDSKPIPACAISIEDADMFQRMSNRKWPIKVTLKLSGKTVSKTAKSHNIIGEITGSKIPEEIILIGGHVDSWDTGPQTGSMDDLAGFYVCYEAVRVLMYLQEKNLIPRPKRTIRVIGWSGEEMGFDENGASSYVKTHDEEMKNHILGFESDEGVTDIYGFGYSGESKGYSVVNFISTLLKGLKMDKLSDDGEMVDTGPLHKLGIPSMSPMVAVFDDQREYFQYHHSAADTISTLNPDFMDRNVIGIASMFYAISNLPLAPPRNS